MFEEWRFVCVWGGGGVGGGGEIPVVQSGDSHPSCEVTGTHVLETSEVLPKRLIGY